MTYDVVVLGGGPGGISCAGYLAKAGLNTLLIEKSTFPRFKIGESLLPYSLEIFKDLDFLPILQKKFLQKNGALFFDFKSGKKINFDFSNSGKARFPYAFEVIRSDFDKFFLDHVHQKFGVKILQPCFAKSFDFSKDSITLTLNNNQKIQSRFVVDATGKNSTLGNSFYKIKKTNSFNDMACFAHFSDLPRETGSGEGDITIGILDDGAWLWHIPFMENHSSLGIVCSRKKYKEINDEENLFEYFSNLFPKFKKYISGGHRVSEISFASNYSYTRDFYFGDRWILIGDSMGFLDPIFSTGVHIALYSGKLAAQTLLQAHLENKNFTTGLGRQYQDRIQLGYKRFSGLLDIFYSGHFMDHMEKALQRDRMRHAFTDLLAGGAWNDSNILFKLDIV